MNRPVRATSIDCLFEMQPYQVAWLQKIEGYKKQKVVPLLKRVTNNGSVLNSKGSQLISNLILDN